MKCARNSIILTTALCVVITLQACGSASDSTAPPSANPEPSNPSPVPASIVALSSLDQPGWAGFDAILAPAVKVVDRNGIPIANIAVSFAVTRGDGLVGNATATTTQGGLATTSWRLGATGGVNTVTASVQGLDAVSFQATAKVPVIVARYKLTEIGGRPVPVQFITGDAPEVVTNGHYLLTDANEFAFGYEINGIDYVRPTGTFVRVDATTIQFILSPGSYPASQFYQSRNGLFATGYIDGNTMTVNYEDFIDFETEKYILTGG